MCVPLCVSPSLVRDRGGVPALGSDTPPPPPKDRQTQESVKTFILLENWMGEGWGAVSTPRGRKMGPRGGPILGEGGSEAPGGCRGWVWGSSV